MHVITEVIACARAHAPEVDGGNSYLKMSTLALTTLHFELDIWL